MSSGLSFLESTTLSLIEYIRVNLGECVIGYIDPNTMHHVFTSLGPILAFFAAASGVIFSVAFFLRHHLVSWFRKTSGVKWVAVWLILVSIATSTLIFAYNLILHLATD